MRAFRLTTALVAAAASAALLAGIATPIANATEGTVRTEAVAPRLLSKDMLPETSRFSNWHQTPVQAMDSQGFCEEDAFPSEGTLTRVFYNTRQGNAITQYAAEMTSKAAAKKAVARIKRCYAKRSALAALLGTANVLPRVWGVLDVADGLTVGDLDHRSSTSPGLLMWAVGRDGRYVTLLQFPLVTEGKTPKKAWLKLSKKALRHVAA